jgi:hypothetical protein
VSKFPPLRNTVIDVIAAPTPVKNSELDVGATPAVAFERM